MSGGGWSIIFCCCFYFIFFSFFFHFYSFYFFYIFQYLETSVTKGNIVARYPVMSAEWIVTCNVRFTEIVTDKTSNIFHFKSNKEQHVHGVRHPAMYSLVNSTTVLIKSNINGNLYYTKQIPLEMNVKAHIEIHQRYVSNGNYRFFIIKDGQEIFSIINNDAQPVYDTLVYVSNGWSNPSTAVLLSNLEFTNFL